MTGYGIIGLNLRLIFSLVMLDQDGVYYGYFGLKSQVMFFSEVAGLNTRFGFTLSVLRIHPKLSSTLCVLVSYLSFVSSPVILGLYLSFGSTLGVFFFPISG